MIKTTSQVESRREFIGTLILTSLVPPTILGLENHATGAQDDYGPQPRTPAQQRLDGARKIKLSQWEVETQNKFPLIPALEEAMQMHRQGGVKTQAEMTDLVERRNLERDRRWEAAKQTTVTVGDQQWIKSSFDTLKVGGAFLIAGAIGGKIDPRSAAATAGSLNIAADMAESGAQDIAKRVARNGADPAIIASRLAAKEALSAEERYGRERNTPEQFDAFEQYAARNPEFKKFYDEQLDKLGVKYDPRLNTVTSPNDPSAYLSPELKAGIEESATDPKAARGVANKILKEVVGQSKLPTVKPTGYSKSDYAIDSERAYAAEAVLNFGTGMVGLLGGKEERAAAARVATAGEAIIGAYRSISKFRLKPEEFGRMALTGDLIGAGLSILGAIIGSGPTADEMILEELGELRKEVASLHNAMLSAFEGVNSKLNSIQFKLDQEFAQINRILADQSLRLREIQGELASVHSSLHRLSASILSLEGKIQQNIIDLDQLRFDPRDRQGARRSDYFTTPLEEKPFEGYLAEYVSRATVGARNSLSGVGSLDRKFSNEEVIQRLNKTSPHSGVDYLAGFLSSRKLGHDTLGGIGERVIPDGDAWLVASRSAIQLVVTNPKYIKNVTVKNLDEVIASGDLIFQALLSLAYTTDKSDHLISNRALYLDILAKYENVINDQEAVVTGIISRIRKDYLANGSLEQDPGECNKVALFPDTPRDRTKFIFPAKVTSKAHTTLSTLDDKPIRVPGGNEKTMPPTLKLLVPDEVVELDSLRRKRGGGSGGLNLVGEYLPIRGRKIEREDTIEFFDAPSDIFAATYNPDMRRRGFVEKLTVFIPSLQIAIIDTAFGEVLTLTTALRNSLARQQRTPLPGFSGFYVRGESFDLDDLSWDPMTGRAIQYQGKPLYAPPPDWDSLVSKEEIDKVYYTEIGKSVDAKWNRVLSLNPKSWSLSLGDGFAKLAQKLEEEKAALREDFNRELTAALVSSASVPAKPFKVLTADEVEELGRSAAELSSIKAALRQGLLAAFPDMARLNENLANVISGDRQLIGQSKIAELVGATSPASDAQVESQSELKYGTTLEELTLPRMLNRSAESSVPRSSPNDLTEIKKEGDEITSNGELQTVAPIKGMPVIKAPLTINSLFGNDIARGSYRDRINQTRKDLNEFFDRVDSDINKGRLPNPSLDILSTLHELQALREEIAGRGGQ